MKVFFLSSRSPISKRTSSEANLNLKERNNKKKMEPIVESTNLIASLRESSDEFSKGTISNSKVNMLCSLQCENFQSSELEDEIEREETRKNIEKYSQSIKKIVRKEEEEEFIPLGSSYEIEEVELIEADVDQGGDDKDTREKLHENKEKEGNNMTIKTVEGEMNTNNENIMDWFGLPLSPITPPATPSHLEYVNTPPAAEENDFSPSSESKTEVSPLVQESQVDDVEYGIVDPGNLQIIYR
jgi:hypothetical protein